MAAGDAESRYTFGLPGIEPALESASNRMKKSSTLITRLLAVVALVVAVVAVLMVVSGNSGSDDDPAKKGNQAAKTNGQGGEKKQKSKRAAYEVQEGDTLTAISQKTGVSVDEIENLNPELDPQALQAGQKLKLR